MVHHHYLFGTKSKNTLSTTFWAIKSTLKSIFYLLSAFLMYLKLTFILLWLINGCNCQQLQPTDGKVTTLWGTRWVSLASSMSSMSGHGWVLTGYSLLYNNCCVCSFVALMMLKQFGPTVAILWSWAEWKLKRMGAAWTTVAHRYVKSSWANND